MISFRNFSVVYILILCLIQYLSWDYRAEGVLGYTKNTAQAAMLFMVICSQMNLINIKIQDYFELKAIVAFIVAFGFEYGQKFGAFKVSDPVTKRMSATYDTNDLIAYALGILISYIVMQTLKNKFIKPDE
jgi:hypothetical protein